MNEPNQNPSESLEQKLNRDTARINWSALNKYQQQAAVIEVNSELDLVTVACEFARDNHNQVKAWLDQSQISKVSDGHAQAWKADDRQLWAVVVAPWVLVQDEQRGRKGNSEKSE